MRVAAVPLERLPKFLLLFMLKNAPVSSPDDDENAPSRQVKHLRQSTLTITNRNRNLSQKICGRHLPLNLNGFICMVNGIGKLMTSLARNV